MPTMRIVFVLLVSTTVSACESQPQEVSNVRAAASTMEESGRFAIGGAGPTARPGARPLIRSRPGVLGGCGSPR